MNTPIMPPTIAPPAAKYAHATLSTGVSLMLHTSGVVPIAPDGSVPDDLGEQATVVWANIAAILEEADMSASDIVSITTYVVVGHLGELAVVMEARDRVLDGHRTASTLVTVPALVRPEWKLEIAVVATR
jgi:enamine deaminase RidA (YjgF/YER057c/UK114 family)